MAVSSKVTILLPDTVLCELVAQRERLFNSEIASLQKNSVYKLLYARSIEKIDYQKKFEEIRERLLSDRSIPYTVICISDQITALNRISDLAYRQHAPFQKSGAGFKDALIALTIEECLNRLTPGQKAFFVCDDQLLASYFTDFETLIVCKNLHELSTQLSVGNQRDCQEDRATSSQDVERPSRNEIEEAIVNLERCSSFANAHTAVSQLSSMQDYLSQDDMRRLLVAAVQNDQISQILQDDDIYVFFLPIYKQYQSFLSESQRFAFLSGARMEQVEAPSGEAVLFSRNEINRYRKFSDDVQAHIVVIDPEAGIQSDPSVVVTKLSKVLSECSLEENIPDSRVVINAFVSGRYRYRPKWMSVASLKDFVALLNDSSEVKRSVIIGNIASKLDSLKDYTHTFYSDYDDMPF